MSFDLFGPFARFPLLLPFTVHIPVLLKFLPMQKKGGGGGKMKIIY